MRPKKLRHLLLATLEDVESPSAWSGIPYSTRQSIAKYLEQVSVVSIPKPKRTPLHGAARLLLGGSPPRYPLHLTAPAQREYARRTSQAIQELQPDAVLSLSSHCLLYLPPQQIPIVMFTDAPYLTWMGAYSEFEKIPINGRRFAHYEAKAAQRCDGLFFASHWAAKDAESLYDIPPHKIKVHPMGANYVPEESALEIRKRIASRAMDQLDLLFVGKDWLRKGGPLAVEIAQRLYHSGRIKVCLHIVGCSPCLDPKTMDIVKIHGLLRMSIPQERERLNTLFYQSHFLLVPTRAECFGLVFAEAQAFGLPPISHSVHAVPEVVLDGRTGILEDPGTSAKQFVKRILDVISSSERYQQMAHGARSHYEERLNWDAFARALVESILELT